MSKETRFLMLLTVLLVALGCVLYGYGYVGWAQLYWVMASGTAGAGVAMWIDDRHD